MDFENIWSDGQNESSNPTTSNAVPQSYMVDPSYISAHSYPAFYNVPPCGSKEIPRYNNYLAEPHQDNINSYHPYYNHRNAMMAHGVFRPFPSVQTCIADMKHKNCSQINNQLRMGIRAPGNIMRSNRKNKQKNKKQQPENNKSNFSFGPKVPNCIITGNNNQQNNFGATANVYKALPENNSLSIGNGGNRNDNRLLNECSFEETNLDHSTASENLANLSTNFNLSGELFNAARGVNEVGLDFESATNVHYQDENFANFGNEGSKGSDNCNIIDGVFTNASSIQPLDKTQLPDASDDNASLDAQDTINVVISDEGEEKTFSLQKISEVQDENGKNVILLLAAPEIQQQIAQGSSVDQIVEEQSAQAEENVSPRGDASGTVDTTFLSNENVLSFEQNDAVESCQEVTDRNATFSSNIDEHFGYETTVRTSKCRNRKRRNGYSHRHTQPKKFIRSNAKAGTAIARETLRPRCRRFSSDKDLQNKYFNFRQFAKEHFKENHINDKQLQNLMMIMLKEIGGNVLQSICCFFQTLTKNFNAKTH